MKSNKYFNKKNSVNLCIAWVFTDFPFAKDHKYHNFKDVYR